MGRAPWLAALCLALSWAPLASAQNANLRIMTFNVWSGEQSAGGMTKLTEIIQTAGADVVGVQELNDSAGRTIAAALGFHYHQQSGGDIQVISRFPIVGQSANNLGVEIEMAPGRRFWLFNAHLSAYPYQPYDLRDRVLPMTESAVIAAANAARGGEVTTYLSSMAGALGSGLPVFFTGDFNEPSHLDWTAAAAAATARNFDLKVEYPASSRIVDAGLIDSFRAVRPDVVNDRAYTWTPGYPYPSLSANEVHDRIDLIYHRGFGVLPVDAWTVGPPDGSASTDLAINGYNADHRAVVAEYAFASLGDLNADGQLDVADWTALRQNQLADFSGMSADEAWRRGDLNGDRRNDHADFVLFKQAFDDAHGAGSFAALAIVPEPTSWAMAALAAALAAGRYSRRTRCAA